MPSFRKLSTREVKALIAKRERAKAAGERARVRQEYRDYLAKYRPGDWVVVELQEGENRVTVKNRLLRAAKDLDYELDFMRTRGRITLQIRKEES